VPENDKIYAQPETSTRTKSSRPRPRTWP